MQLALHRVRSSRSPRRLDAGARRGTPRPLPTVLHESDSLQLALGVEQLFEFARDALVIVALDTGRIVRWNPAAEDLFGYEANAAVGRSIDIVLPADAARLHRERVCHYQRTAEDEVFTGRPPIRLMVRTRDGGEAAAELSMAPLEIPGCPAKWLLLTFRDARCHHDLERANLAVARAQTERADAEAQLERYGALISQGSHDLSKPLARVRRASQRLARATSSNKNDTPGRLALMARVLQSRTDQFERQLASMSDAAAIEAGTLELNTARVNLVPLVGRLVADTRAQSTEHRFNFAAPQGLTATCDAERITRVVEDLIRRAVQRNPRGCWIDVDLRRPLAGMACIEVRDYGRSLSSRERDALLRRSSADSDRAWFVAREILELHRGTLRIEFPREGGVRTIMTLPAHRGRRPAAPPPPAVHPPV